MRPFLLAFTLAVISFCGIASPPPAESVFLLSAKPLDPNTLRLQWEIKPGFFLYQKRIQLTPADHANFHLGPVRYPKAHQKTDKQGRIEPVYQKELTLPIAILGEHPGEALLEVHYQGCASDGFCYPPQRQAIILTIDDKLRLTQAQIDTIKPQPTVSEQTPDEIEAVFSSESLVLIILGFLGFGLLLSFTPCVLPMVPVLSGIIVGHGKDLTTRKAFFLSLSYVLSMALTYAVVGAMVALIGQNLQIAMQSPWVISLFSLVFILLALSMFGFYELRLPLSWQNKLAGVTRTHEGGHYLGAALMGSLSTLILSPCVTAPLIGALGYIAQTGNMLFGGMALFSLGLGMGLPLLIIGASAGKLLPKAGNWMNAIKAFFGVLLIAMAIYLMSRILPPVLTMGLWSSLLIFSGSYLNPFKPSEHHHEKLSQGFGLILLSYGLLILIGASQGNTNPLQPLKSHASNSFAAPLTDQNTVKSLAELEPILKAAQGRPVMIDFYADWCTSCQVLEATTLQDPTLLSAMKDWVIIRADITDHNAQSKALMTQYQVVAPPTFIFLDDKGKERQTLRTVGEVSAHQLVQKLSAS